MKEIKFRGKDIDTGKWVFGYYEYCHVSERHMIKYTDMKPEEVIKTIIPETLGQYIGIRAKCKGGRWEDDIYEGDILWHEDFGYMIVKWSPSRLAYIMKAIKDNSYEYADAFRKNDDSLYCELVGNIHDDPTSYQ